MKNKDKVIAAFLVSMGLFSTTQATQYVSALSTKDKQALSAVAQDDNNNSGETVPRQLTINDND